MTVSVDLIDPDTDRVSIVDPAATSVTGPDLDAATSSLCRHGHAAGDRGHDPRAAMIRERVGAAALIADEGCSMDLQPDQEGRGSDVRSTIGTNAETWVIEGPGC